MIMARALEPTVLLRLHVIEPVLGVAYSLQGKESQPVDVRIANGRTLLFEIPARIGASFKAAGEMMPMQASDGPHYGDNVKLSGPGKYQLKLTVLPPSAKTHAHFGRHVDKETGIAAWFTPFNLNYDFTFAGTGISIEIQAGKPSYVMGRRP